MEHQPQENGALRVLVVDDDPDAVALVECLLRAAGHTTLHARDGAEGVAMAAAERPHVVLMDLDMPRMDGFDAARAIRAQGHGQRVPIVAVSSYAMAGSREPFEGSLFDGHISKPLSPYRFAPDLARWVSSFGS